ncbi:MAG: phosphoadenylyl-sulfate reductase, partial [Caulobacteraceae bacterium]
QQGKALFDQGEKLYGEKKYTEALAKFSEAEKNNYKEATLYILRGNCQLNLNDDDAALKSYTQAIKTDPKSTRALYNRAIVYKDNSQYDLAVADPDAKLWQTDTDACCNVRKVLPLDHALTEFDAWITGRKRFHGGDRLSLPVVEPADAQVKFNPLANWGKAELDAYMSEHDLPAHPLVAQGFPSIGCWPCTKPVEEGQDVRAGRWAGQDKTECGIHVARAPGAVANVGGDI